MAKTTRRRDWSKNPDIARITDGNIKSGMRYIYSLAPPGSSNNNIQKRRATCLNLVIEKSAARDACLPSCNIRMHEISLSTLQPAPLVPQAV